LDRNCFLILRFHVLIREATNEISTKNRKSKSVYSMSFGTHRFRYLFCKHYDSQALSTLAYTLRLRQYIPISRQKAKNSLGNRFAPQSQIWNPDGGDPGPFFSIPNHRLKMPSSSIIHRFLARVYTLLCRRLYIHKSGKCISRQKPHFKS